MVSLVIVQRCDSEEDPISPIPVSDSSADSSVIINHVQFSSSDKGHAMQLADHHWGGIGESYGVAGLSCSLSACIMLLFLWELLAAARPDMSMDRRAWSRASSFAVITRLLL